MSTAVMPTSTIYDLGELLLKHPAPGLSNSIGSSGGSTSSSSSSSSSSSTSSNPGSPGSGSSMTSNCGSMMLVRPNESNNSKMSLMRWNAEDRETLSRRASHPVANSVASLVTTLLLDNLNNHRRLDRSQSDPAKAAALSVNTSRYKTELCRPFEENGSCKYGDKCQFAHGGHELRNLVRHPKYKTELCRTFHTVGFCPYGPRCHFIHNAEEARAAGIAIKSSRPRLCLPPAPGLGSSADSPSPPSSLGSGSPPPSANTAFSFAPLVPTPTSLSPSQSPPPPPASPETRLPVFNKLSGQVVQFTLRIGELIA